MTPAAMPNVVMAKGRHSDGRNATAHAPHGYPQGSMAAGRHAGRALDARANICQKHLVLACVMCLCGAQETLVSGEPTTFCGTYSPTRFFVGDLSRAKTESYCLTFFACKFPKKSKHEACAVIPFSLRGLRAACEGMAARKITVA